MKAYFKHVGFNSIGEIGSRIPFLVTEIVIAKQLGVTLYGYWAIIQLAVNYNNFGHFGIYSGLVKLEPINIGRNKLELVKKLRESSFYSVLVLNVIVILSIIALVFLTKNTLVYGESSDVINFPLMLSMCALLISQQLFLYAQTRLQNVIQFSLLSKGKIIYSIVFMVLVLLMFENVSVVYLVNFWAVAFFSASIYLYCKGALLPKLNIDMALTKTLLITGFPVFILGLTKLYALSIDKFVVLNIQGIEYLSVYNISMQAMLIMGLVIGMLSRVFSPMFLRLVGMQNRSADDFYSFAKTISLEGGAVLAFVLCGVFSVCINLLLGEYQLGIVPGLILIFSGVYQGSVQFAITRAISQDMEFKVVKYFLFCSFIYTIFLYMAASYNENLIVVALINFLFWSVFDNFIENGLGKSSNVVVKQKNYLVYFLLAMSISIYLLINNIVYYSITVVIIALLSVIIVGMLNMHIYRNKISIEI